MTDPEANQTLFTQWGWVESVALKPPRTGAFPWTDFLAFNVQPDEPQGQTRETSAAVRAEGRKALGRAQQCGEAEWEQNHVSTHKPSPETPSCCSVSPPDGFIFRCL